MSKFRAPTQCATRLLTYIHLRRAWHLAHIPSATIRLATHYLPVQTAIPEAFQAALTAQTEPPTTPRCSSARPSFAILTSSTPDASNHPSSAGQAWDPVSYYLTRLGGLDNLARLFLEAGLLYFEGSATPLLSSSYAGLSSVRSPNPSPGASISASGSVGGTKGWKKNREAARRLFERARALCPTLDVPLLPPDTESESSGGSGAEDQKEKSADKERQRLPGPSADVPPIESLRRRRKKPEGDWSNFIMGGVLSREAEADDDDRTWYLYIPGLVGAGTALLVVGLLGLSSWRKGQGS